MNGNFKYIRGKTGWVIFGDDHYHKEVKIPDEIISAGQIVFAGDKLLALGESSTLDLKALPEDTEFFKNIFGMKEGKQ